VIRALGSVQWSPLLVAAVLSSSLGAIVFAKPTIGCALAVYRLDGAWWRRTLLGAGLLCALAFALQPAWLQSWVGALSVRPAAYTGIGRHTAQYLAPITCTGGAVVLLALLRWRRPEARLLIALACAPQVLYGYELVPLLLLVPATRREALGLTLLSHTIPFFPTPPPEQVLGNWELLFRAIGNASIWAVYAPAVLVILMRSNDGDVPRWLDRVACRIRVGLAGFRRW
jgi:hypothetical protein